MASCPSFLRPSHAPQKYNVKQELSEECQNRNSMDHTCKYNSSIASKTRTTPTFLVAKKYQSMKNDKVTAANCVIHSHSDRSPDCEGK